MIIGSFESLLGERERHVFRWTQTEGFTDLGAMGGDHAIVNGVSADGSVLAGWFSTGRTRGIPTGKSRAFVWSKKAGITDLGYMKGKYADAQAVSADGSIVVGTWTDNQGKSHGYVLQLGTRRP